MNSIPYSHSFKHFTIYNNTYTADLISQSIRNINKREDLTPTMNIVKTEPNFTRKTVYNLKLIKCKKCSNSIKTSTKVVKKHKL